MEMGNFSNPDLRKREAFLIQSEEKISLSYLEPRKREASII
jgi:hypothetical protein